MTKKILVNLKDWFDLHENIAFAKKVDGLDIILFPGMPYLYIYKDIDVTLGSQDVSSFGTGAHTGSVSIEHLKEFNITCVLLNHNELRVEDNEILFDKVYHAIEENTDVVICINDTTERELKKIDRIFGGILDTSRISIAYEPKEELELDEIKRKLSVIRERLEKYKYDSLIYGGSVSQKNISIYNDEIEVDGYLISRHALDIDELQNIINLVK